MPPIDYQRQLDEKVRYIKQLFSSEIKGAELAVFDSPPKHFRQRAEFRIWHERDPKTKQTIDIFYAMFEPGQRGNANSLKKITQLPIASQAINRLMPKLLEIIKQDNQLLKKLYQAEFLATKSGEMLVTLIYHKPLTEDWQHSAKLLTNVLNIKLVGRSKKQKVVLSDDFVTENLNVMGKTYTYQQIEGGFTQPNADVCEKMLTWSCGKACQIAKSLTEPLNKNNQSNDLLELYCGNGNFTLPLSQYFDKTLATEIAKSSILSAKENIKNNQINHIEIARLSAEELTQAMNKVRPFKRLLQENIELDNYHFCTIFVDPPRAGIDDDTLKMMAQFDHILYISCNPSTLRDNLDKLNQTHSVKAMALFDQFPYTHHIEMGVWLKKR